MQSHTANVVRSCFYQLRQFVANRVNYCNAVLYGMSTAVTHWLQYRWYWMPPLIWSLVSANTSTLHWCFVTLFTGCQSLRGYSSRLMLWWSLTMSEVLVLSSAQPRTCHVGHSVRLAAETCLFVLCKHVHRPAKSHHGCSSRLECTSTWSPLTSQIS